MVQVNLRFDPAAVVIELLGVDDRSSLFQGQVAPALSKAGVTLLQGANRFDGVVALVRHDVSDEELEELAANVGRRVRSLGRRCDVGGLPLFVVLRDAGRLAYTGDALADWLQRLETAKGDLHRKLRSVAVLPWHSGFGSMTLHVSAIDAQRPELKDAPAEMEPFGVSELAAGMIDQAKAHARRRTAQGGRLLRVSWGMAALLAAMLGGAGLLLGARVLAPPMGNLEDSVGPAATTRADRLRDLLTRGRKLLHFDGYRAGEPSATRWPRWYRDAAELRADYQAALSRPASADAAEARLLAELTALDQGLNQLQETAALFGLAGQDGPLGDQPPLLNIPAKFTVDQARERLNELRKNYPDFRPRPVPDEIPLAVARELTATARANYEKLLEPARQLVANRLREASVTGAETPEAWRRLANGWLAQRADLELTGWRELALLVAQLAGDESPHDPLVQLQTFLRQPHFDLPVGRIELQLPDELTPGNGRKLRPSPVGPLRLRLQSPDGKDAIAEVLQLQKGRRSEEPYVFLNEHSHLRFEPGGKLTAQVPVTDEEGNRWLLTWPAGESPSKVYTFAVLMQAPRLHPDLVADPTRGELAFEVRLILSQPDSFQLPDLMPR